jgi:hypothetical protein
MISGVHVIIYSQDAVADRAFFKDTLGLASVDAGDGWLSFSLPPAEAAFHPSHKNDVHELYLMCDTRLRLGDLSPAAQIVVAGR